LKSNLTIHSLFIAVIAVTLILAGNHCHAQDSYTIVINALTDEAEEYIGNEPYKLDSIAEVIARAATKEGDPKSLSMAKMYDGIASAMTGDHGPALEGFQEAWVYAIDANDTVLQVNALTNMAGVYKFAGQPDKAEEKLAKALEILDDPEMQPSRANTLLALGILQEETGRFSEASESISYAMRIFDEVEDVSLYLSCVERLGGIMQHTGNVDGALSLYSFALKGRDEAHQQGMTIPIYRSLGDAYIQKGQFAKAKVHLETALSMGDSLNYLLMMDSTLVRLIRVSAALADPSAINKYTKRLVQYHDAQEDKSVRETLASLENEYLLNEQKLINRALLAESEQARLEVTNSRLYTIGLIIIVLLLLAIAIVAIAFIKRVQGFNKQLEVKVDEKTHEVIERNNKLKETSFKLARELRSGVSTLLGAKQLLDENGVPPELDKELYDAIGDSTEKLDHTIKAMIKNLDEFE